MAIQNPIGSCQQARIRRLSQSLAFDWNCLEGPAFLLQIVFAITMVVQVLRGKNVN